MESCNLRRTFPENSSNVIFHAVPGDILVVSGRHVVIIQNLNYPDDTMQITNFRQVDVIHSTSGIDKQWQTYKVHKGNWFQVEGNDYDDSIYQLRRLRVNEN